MMTAGTSYAAVPAASSTAVAAMAVGRRHDSRPAVRCAAGGTAAGEHNSNLGVVITGGSKGLGFALAREFLAAQDKVVICGRDARRVEHATAALQASERIHSVMMMCTRRWIVCQPRPAAVCSPALPRPARTRYSSQSVSFSSSRVCLGGWDMAG